MAEPGTTDVADSEQLQKFPLAILCVALVLGILVGHKLTLGITPVLLAGLLAYLLALVAVIRHSAGSLYLICAAFALAGVSLETVRSAGPAPNRLERFYDQSRLLTPGQPVEVTGIVRHAPEPAPDGKYFDLDLESVSSRNDRLSASGVVQFFAPSAGTTETSEYNELELRRGARVRVLARLERGERFRNPGGSSFNQYLEQNGLDAAGSIKSPLMIERLDDVPVFLPLLWLDEWRIHLVNRIDSLFSTDTAGILKAAALGDRYGISHATAERFRDGGIFHLLVVGGLHIGFIAGLVFALMRFVTRKRMVQFATSMLFIWVYAFAVGARESVVRAALVFSLVSLAAVLHRRINALNALGAAGLILLAMNSHSLFDPAFQLTFTSVAAIVTLGWPVVANLHRIGSWRPNRQSAYPPGCPKWLKRFSETLFWSERRWRSDLARENYNCRLFKSRLAGVLERLRLQRALQVAFGAVVISASVQIGLLPLLIIYFHRVSLASFGMNVFAGALMAALGALGLCGLAISWVSPGVAAPFLWLAEKTASLLQHSIDPLSSSHLASLRLPHYSGWAALFYLLYFVSLAFVAVSLARWNPLGAPRNKDDAQSASARSSAKFATVSLAVCLAIILAHPLSAGRPDGRFSIDFLDVGQGDSALLKMPGGATLLLDGGGRPRITAREIANQQDVEEPFERDARGIGDAVVSEYLWWRGLDRIDYILGSHAHADHIDGLSDVARNFSIGSALVGRAPANDGTYARFSATMRREGVPVLLLNRGDRLQFGPVVADVLWPPRSQDPGSATSANDDSVVLRLRFGKRVFLLTGDVEKGAEAAILSAGDDLRSDLVKVAHHGSHTSSTSDFVTASHPALAVVSVGRESPFGHPDREVIDRWRASGANVLVTGQDGTVSVSTDGEDLKFYSFASTNRGLR